MPSRVLQKSVDIYQYPKEFEGNSGSITIGDLHGNAVKFVHFLLRHEVVTFKSHLENPSKIYAQFVDLYDKMGAAIEVFKDAQRTIKSEQNLMERHQKNIARYNELTQQTERTEKEEYELAGLSKPEQLQSFINQNEQKIVRATQDIEHAKHIVPGLVKEFNQFINQLEVSDKEVTVRLIGDELADRGSNDYFTLRLLGLLSDNQVKVHITISNHSNEFIAAYENLYKKQGLNAKGDVSDPDKLSFIGLKMLLDDGVISETEVTALVDKAYKPSLKIIGYTLGDQGISLFTHAPVRFEIVQHIANNLGVVYDDSSKEALAATIDKINVKFGQIVAENRIQEFCDTSAVQMLENLTAQEMAAYPLVNVIWNRWSEKADTDEARPPGKNGYAINYVHGHDPYQSVHAHVNNLDTSCGKGAPRQIEKKLAEAQAVVDSLTESPQIKVQAQAYIDGVNNYKVLDSNEQSLNHQFTPQQIDAEFKQKNTSKSFFGSLFDKIAQTAKNAWEGISQLGKTIASNIEHSAQKLWSTVKETVSDFINPNHKEKHECAQAMHAIRREISLYHGAKDRLKLHLGHENLQEYSSREIKADMKIMREAAVNLKKMDLPPGLEKMVQKFAFVNDRRKLDWGAYDDCVKIQRGELNHHDLFARLDANLEKIAKQQPPQTPLWNRQNAQESPRSLIINHKKNEENIQLTQASKQAINSIREEDASVKAEKEEEVRLSIDSRC